MRTKLQHNAAFIQLPIGLEKDCKGVVDLVREEALYFEGEFGEKIIKDEVPKDMRAEVADYRQELIEHVSNVDEKLGKILFITSFRQLSSNRVLFFIHARHLQVKMRAL